jgi:MFS transporter, DHA1 family, inner membrane transport protein
MIMNCVFMLGCGGLMGMWALLPMVSPSMRALGATSGLITQITLAGVLFGPPAALLSLTHETAGFLVFVVLALATSLAGLPVWIRASRAPATPGAAGLAAHHG